MADPIRVLVVDDTSHVRSMLRTMLELDGFDVVGEAGSGAEAIEQLPDAKPDVVVVDFKMPDMDGIETTRQIREQNPDQVVILYTAFLDDDLHQRAKEAGVTVALGKVSGLSSLELEIRRQCEQLF